MLFDSQKNLQKSRRRGSRRRFLSFGLTAVAGYSAYRWLRNRPTPITQREVRYITPIEDFYTVSISGLPRPLIDVDRWQLAISSHLDKRITLDYDQLRALPSTRMTKTLICIENPVGGSAMGNADWTATPLSALLQRLLPAETSRQGLRVIFRAADGFFTSVPLQTALEDGAAIAYEMNGRRLPDRHGYPARLLLPSKYGMKQPKWLTEIEITDRWVRGYWENQGWSYDCEVRMTARIDSCRPSKGGIAPVDGDEWTVAGIAYCGGRSVGRVELSDDDGGHWHRASLTSPRIEGAWSTWEWTWRPRARGRQVLAARVVDSLGQEQIERSSGSFPNGSTGIHRVIVRI